jgi:hypothetical protein
MMDNESYRKLCLKQQTELRKIMGNPDQHEDAIHLFMCQHAMLHSAKIAHTEPWSFEDAVLNDMTEQQIRHIPQNCDHSVAWTIWHIARIEDTAMNLLAAGTPQVLDQDNWVRQMNVDTSSTGNAMEEEDISDLSARIELPALRDYRAAVGRRTRQIVATLQPEDLRQKVDPTRIAQVMESGALVESARGIAEYWSKRDIAGLLLMPATRHNLVHLNEALKLKRGRT